MPAVNSANRSHNVKREQVRRRASFEAPISIRELIVKPANDWLCPGKRRDHPARLKFGVNVRVEQDRDNLIVRNKHLRTLRGIAIGGNGVNQVMRRIGIKASDRVNAIVCRIDTVARNDQLRALIAIVGRYSLKEEDPIVRIVNIVRNSDRNGRQRRVKDLCNDRASVGFNYMRTNHVSDRVSVSGRVVGCRRVDFDYALVELLRTDREGAFFDDQRMRTDQ